MGTASARCLAQASSPSPPHPRRISKAASSIRLGGGRTVSDQRRRRTHGDGCSLSHHRRRMLHRRRRNHEPGRRGRLFPSPSQVLERTVVVAVGARHHCEDEPRQVFLLLVSILFLLLVFALFLLLAFVLIIRVCDSVPFKATTGCFENFAENLIVKPGRSCRCCCLGHCRFIYCKVIIDHGTAKIVAAAMN
ncbi:uncharacterized protein LOC110267583 [Arachis ipaensis]|uniref:uncharacterized protein LOC110267583 n=1 Tax=Arachis ipaensis TaxID=130454 RepID=UPI000A2B17FD|nr:uncharacterized protein LOC110267583 [Arachis ipaensis]XP_020968993.1 uncharacterized protein LOC110267583 [Arachis ipaensis]XP_025635318.1 uncharacterized protein LOC112729215 [Arachis hypogaea]QHO23610.1 uncharacterized protein DS421_12g365050 [Arachis hypogaea]